VARGFSGVTREPWLEGSSPAAVSSSGVGVRSGGGEQELDTSEQFLGLARARLLDEQSVVAETLEQWLQSTAHYRIASEDCYRSCPRNFGLLTQVPTLNLIVEEDQVDGHMPRGHIFPTGRSYATCTGVENR
jgi:hypothetical protein